MSLEAALDWLCLHLPHAQLPRRFAGGIKTGHAGGSVRLLARASDAPQARQNRPMYPPSESSESDGSDNDGEPGGGGDRDERDAAEEAGEGGKGPPADDRSASKAWILQYMQQSDESGGKLSWHAGRLCTRLSFLVAGI